MAELFEEWVYRNLKKYKNCAIDNKIVWIYGEKTVLDELRKHGFECKLIQTLDVYESQFNRTKKYTFNYIVEVDHHGTF